jgi:hypothetical protein
MTTNEILIAHGLDFNISKRPLKDDDNNPSGYFGLWNDSIPKCINTVKDGYHVSQNRDVVDLVLAGIAPFGNDLSVSKAGSLNEGRKVFIQLKIAGDGFVNGDRIERYITIIDSNDGSTSLSVGIGDKTMSCQNQFFAFYKEGQSKFRHSALMSIRIKELPRLIETALSQSIKQIEVYNQLANQDITKDLAHKMVKYVLGYDRVYTSVADLSEKSTRSINIMNKLYDCIDSEIEDKGLNLWGLFSGVTKYTTHEMSNVKRENGEYEKMLSGRGYAMNQKSYGFVNRESRVLVEV